MKLTLTLDTDEPIQSILKFFIVCAIWRCSLLMNVCYKHPHWFQYLRSIYYYAEEYFQHGLHYCIKSWYDNIVDEYCNLKEQMDVLRRLTPDNLAFLLGHVAKAEEKFWHLFLAFFFLVDRWEYTHWVIIKHIHHWHEPEVLYGPRIIDSRGVWEVCSKGA